MAIHICVGNFVGGKHTILQRFTQSELISISNGIELLSR